MQVEKGCSNVYDRLFPSDRKLPFTPSPGLPVNYSSLGLRSITATVDGLVEKAISACHKPGKGGLNRREIGMLERFLGEELRHVLHALVARINARRLSALYPQPFAFEIDDALKDLIEIVAGLEANQFLDLFHTGNPASHILETTRIRIFVGNVLDL